jgi:error-prone DNA polymerase
MGYVDFAVASNFSFLRGASHPRDLVLTALLLGHRGIGLSDANSVSGVVRAYSALEDLRRDGGVGPQKIKEGSGPGEFVWQEPSGSGQDVLDPARLNPEVLAARARDFKLIFWSIPNTATVGGVCAVSSRWENRGLKRASVSSRLRI